MSQQRVHRISRHVVLGLSLFAMFLVVGAAALVSVGRFNPSPDGDEGTAAHVFQLSIALLLPAGLTFLATADWERPGRIARRLLVPAVALAVAFATLYFMEHGR